MDPNLVLTSNDIYWKFQNFMWKTFFHNSILTGYIYLFLIISLFILYFYILKKLKSKKVNLKKIFFNKYVLIFLVIIAPIAFSYNSLSHDVFNYIFYARMIAKYGVDTKLYTALDFPNDLWIRFMHNTNVTDVYGRGWTYFTLIPYYLGFGKFSLTLAAFRVWSYLCMILLYFSMQNFSMTLFKRRMNLYESAMVFLNPFFLIEYISNYHNDLLMMPFAIYGLSFLIKPITSQISDNYLKVKYFLVSILFLSISISIKYATLALLPIWFLVLLIYLFYYRLAKIVKRRFKINIDQNFIDKIFFIIVNKWIFYIPDLAATIMMLLLFTPRSHQFYPWYFIWVLVWLPFMKMKKLRNLLLVFTVSSSLRYLPWLFNGLEYSPKIIANQTLIVWIIPLIYLFTNIKTKIWTKIDHA